MTMTAGTVMTREEWAAGQRCEPHDLQWCTDCRDRAGIRRDSAGTVSYRSDCAVATFAEITGAGYDAAVQAVTAAGWRPGKGLPRQDLARALTAAGWTVTPAGIRVEHAAAASTAGRKFWVCAAKGRKGHSWTVIGGQQNRPWPPPFRYHIYEVRAGQDAGREGAG